MFSEPGKGRAEMPAYMERSFARVLWTETATQLAGDNFDSHIRIPDDNEPTTRKASSRTVEVLPAACMSCKIKVMMRSAKG